MHSDQRPTTSMAAARADGQDHPFLLKPAPGPPPADGTEEVTYVPRFAEQDETVMAFVPSRPLVPGRLRALADRRETVLGFVILANCVTMGLELDLPWVGWRWVNQVLLVYYTVDLSVRLSEDGFCGFCRSPWNWFDTLIVVAMALEMWVFPLLTDHDRNAHNAVSFATLFLRLCRLLRAVRVFTIVPFIRPLFDLLSALSEAFTAIMWLMVMLILVLYSFALVFTQLLGHDLLTSELSEEARAVAVETFGTVPLSVFGLFRMMSADMTDMGPILSATSGPTLPLCWIAFQICASWLLLTTLTATVVNTMCRVTAQREREEYYMKEAESHDAVRDELKELFDGLDTTGHDEIKRDALLEFLRDPRNAGQLRRIANLEVHSVLGTWDAMQTGGAVHLDVLTDELSTAGSRELDQGMMRLETQVRQLQESVNKIFVHLHASPLHHVHSLPDVSGEDLPLVSQSSPTNSTRTLQRRYAVSSTPEGEEHASALISSPRSGSAPFIKLLTPRRAGSEQCSTGGFRSALARPSSNSASSSLAGELHSAAQQVRDDEGEDEEAKGCGGPQAPRGGGGGGGGAFPPRHRAASAADGSCRGSPPSGAPQRLSRPPPAPPEHALLGRLRAIGGGRARKAGGAAVATMSHGAVVC